MNEQLAELRQRWRTLPTRERQMIGYAALAVLVLIVWTAFFQPAWRALSTLPEQRRTNEIELLEMRRLAAETRELNNQPAISAAQATAALRSAAERLGDKGRLTLQGERATMTLTKIKPEAFQDWLRDIRQGARAKVTDLNLTRDGDGLSGQVVINLPFGR